MRGALERDFKRSVAFARASLLYFKKGLLNNPGILRGLTVI